MVVLVVLDACGVYSLSVGAGVGDMEMSESHGLGTRGLSDSD